MNDKKLYVTILCIGICLFFIPYIFLLYAFSFEINKSLNIVEGARIVLIILLIRVAITSILSFSMFFKWFKQEKQYLSDIPFLFAVFFLFMVFGKLWDILIYFTYYTVPYDTFLILLKIRFFLIVLGFLTMIYLSLWLIFTLYLIKNEKSILQNKKYSRNIKIVVISAILIIETIIISLFPNTTVASRTLPFFVIPPLIMIIWLFLYVYVRKRLSQIHSLLLAIGFILLMVSQLIHPISLALFGHTSNAVLLIEFANILSLVIIFIGVIKKPNY